MEWISEVIIRIADIIKGPLGIFTVSLVSNSIPFVSIPYLVVIASYAMFYQEPTEKLMLIAFSAAGATLGKVIIYSFGAAIRLKLGESTKKNVELFRRVAKKSLFLATALFAATPLPDDILYIPLGVLKYNIVLYTSSVFIGKFFLTSAVVFYAVLIRDIALNTLYLIPVLVAITVFLTYIILRVDWANIIEGLYTGGIFEGSMIFLKEVRKVLRSLIRNINVRIFSVKRN
jgi:membrane protein YqaA with SNARE-associated domain